MPRRKLSEFRAKSLLHSALKQPYTGLAVQTDRSLGPQLKALNPDHRYVVKVDEGVKGRFKKGLVKLDRTPVEVPGDVAALAAQGYRHVLVEPYRPHAVGTERYLALERRREGDVLLFSEHGGVEVEANAAAVQQAPATADGVAQAAGVVGLEPAVVQALADTFDTAYCSFLELNPLVVEHGQPLLLDAAVEVDDQAAPLVSGQWTPADFRDGTVKTPEELAVEELGATSQASFRLTVLNPHGAVFLLLSGGGASIVLADAVYHAGHGAQLANYGEYSGNPTEAETFLYTQQLLSLMLKSEAQRKVLVIGGGVANFTDIRQTFKGVVRALGEVGEAMRAQHIKVYVRRGGPHETEGLAAIAAFLEREGLLGQVSGPDLVLTDIISPALANLEASH